MDKELRKVFGRKKKMSWIKTRDKKSNKKKNVGLKRREVKAGIR
jgi:hypothetical protein